MNDGIIKRYALSNKKIITRARKEPVTYFKSFFSLEAWQAFRYEIEGRLFEHHIDALLKSNGLVSPDKNYMHYTMTTLTESAKKDPKGYAIETFKHSNKFSLGYWAMHRMNL